jgi:lysylphosphatidylglycerol synthetase-like protein (DUF2156 family)
VSECVRACVSEWVIGLESSVRNYIAVLILFFSQVKIVDSLKQEAQSQNKFTRRAFGVVFMVVGFIFIFCLLHFQLEPWTMVHQSRFRSIIPPTYFMAFYVASIYVFFLGAAICKVM